MTPLPTLRPDDAMTCDPQTTAEASSDLEVCVVTAVAIESALMTPEQVADWLQIPARTLAGWRTERRGPRFGRFGRHIRYRRRDIEAFIAEACGRGFDEWQES
jgi:hypothetical protein